MNDYDKMLVPRWYKSGDDIVYLINPSQQIIAALFRYRDFLVKNCQFSLVIYDNNWEVIQKESYTHYYDEFLTKAAENSIALLKKIGYKFLDEKHLSLLDLTTSRQYYTIR